MWEIIQIFKVNFFGSQMACQIWQSALRALDPCYVNFFSTKSDEHAGQKIKWTISYYAHCKKIVYYIYGKGKKIDDWRRVWSCLPMSRTWVNHVFLPVPYTIFIYFSSYWHRESSAFCSFIFESNTTKMWENSIRYA